MLALAFAATSNSTDNFSEKKLKRNGRVLRSLISCLLLLIPGVAQQSKLKPSSIQQSATSNYGKLPLLFVRNQGQTDPRVQFFSNGPRYNVFLMSGEMLPRLSPSQVSSPDAFAQAALPQAETRDPKSGGLSHAPIQSATARTTMVLKLVGAKNNPEIVGEKLQRTGANYFIGNDRRKWRTNVPTYGQVSYRNVYPGTSLVCYGNQHLRQRAALLRAHTGCAITWHASANTEVGGSMQSNLRADLGLEEA